MPRASSASRAQVSNDIGVTPRRGSSSSCKGPRAAKKIAENRRAPEASGLRLSHIPIERDTRPSGCPPMQHAGPKVEELFYAALEFEGSAARSAFLDRACGDPELRRRVEELLDADPEANDLLEVPAPLPAATAPLDSPPGVEEPGTVIGPYKLRGLIGEGGMGVVYVAEQTKPVRRKVALKIIKPGMDTRQVVARFEAERQALALMDHPNIAKVHDAGATGGGRPYFVMELVRGLAITDYCDQARLPVRDRLALFATVCRAVQHAHQKGVIHRDLKPGNVLVTVIDGAPVPKVIDFGVAK